MRAMERKEAVRCTFPVAYAKQLGRPGLRVLAGALALVWLVASGCTTVADHRKLESRVIDMERNGTGAGVKQRVADNGAEIDALRNELQRLEGRLERAEQQAEGAEEDARKARSELALAKLEWQRGVRAGEGAVAAGASSEPSGETSAGSTHGGAAAVAGVDGENSDEALSQEIQAYRFAHAAWRGDDNAACVDRFRKFLQTYPASPYADDAAFWMADCHYKQTDFKNAVLRFDDVVRNYPAGNKAPDALFRQGESLLKLGPGYREAAKRAFERVIKEYPDSERAEEARKQLEVQGAG